MASSTASFLSRRHNLLKSCVKYTKLTLATTFVASMTAATYYRPIPSTPNNDNDDAANNDGDDNISHHSITATSSSSSSSTLAPTTSNRRHNQTFCSPNSPPWNRDHVPLLLQWARGISIGITTLAIRIVMNTYGQYEIVDDECYHKFLEVAIAARRDQHQHQSSSSDPSLIQQQKRGLLTVSNHRSLFDDPGIISCLLPLPNAIQPSYQRWGICSQEYCFNDALPSFIKGYIGAGQVLPICRGQGINQRLLLDFGRHLANGEWCHVFPEGGVWQWEELGGRRQLPGGCVLGSASDFAPSTTMTATTSNDNNNTSDDNNTNNNSNSSSNNKKEQSSSVIIPATTKHKSLPNSPYGKLKWGVGKLIAHAPITPVVIPFAHVGMEKLLPQDEISGKTYLRKDFGKSLLKFVLPRFIFDDKDDGNDSDGSGLRIRIQFGHEIKFDDLIQEHEDKYGPLWKYRGKEPTLPPPSSTKVTKTQATEDWISSKEERILYSKIVKRIEMHLDSLTKEVCAKE
jgi:hypothetical protein